MNKIVLKKFFFIFIVGFFLLIAVSVYAATNIDPANRYAWNDVIGWIDFYSTGNVEVSSSQLSGFASSSVGFIALDCATSPNGNICATSNFKVSNSNGNLSGWGYNNGIGWVSFDSATAGSGFPYQVTFNPSTGDFSGWAWNDIIGWISFNCANTGSCATSNYKTRTTWSASATSAILTSSIFDTGISAGAAINAIIWQGDMPSGTSVRFQIASSASSTGPWIYRGPAGSSAEGDVYQPTNANISMPINPFYHNNHRYFRYKAILISNPSQTLSPRIDDVIINWSP